MNTNLYQNAKLSSIRFVKELGLVMSPPITEFVDLDAHAELDKLPKVDFLALMGFSIQFDGNHFTVFLSVVTAVWGDPDLMRLTKAVNLVCNALQPGKTVALWDGDAFNQWMAVGHDPAVEPTDKTDQRALQVCTVRLLGVRH